MEREKKMNNKWKLDSYKDYIGIICRECKDSTRMLDFANARRALAPRALHRIASPLP